MAAIFLEFNSGFSLMFNPDIAIIVKSKVSQIPLIEFIESNAMIKDFFIFCFFTCRERGQLRLCDRIGIMNLAAALAASI
jgi:hypothetical protein